MNDFIVIEKAELIQFAGWVLYTGFVYLMGYIHGKPVSETGGPF